MTQAVFRLRVRPLATSAVQTWVPRGRWARKAICFPSGDHVISEMKASFGMSAFQLSFRLREKNFSPWVPEVDRRHSRFASGQISSMPRRSVLWLMSLRSENSLLTGIMKCSPSGPIAFRVS